MLKVRQKRYYLGYSHRSKKYYKSIPSFTEHATVLDWGKKYFNKSSHCDREIPGIGDCYAVPVHPLGGLAS